MKRHIQFSGVRNWYGDDLIDLEAEPMKVLDGFFTEFGNFVISGCRVTANGATYNVSPGLVALQGKGPDNEDVRVVASFEGAEGVPMPLYLTLQYQIEQAVYNNQNLQPVAYIYKAIASSLRPTGSHVQLSAKGCVRFNDALQDSLHRFITDAERNLWNGKESPAGAQVKADQALATARIYADTKETPEGAQAKADTAFAAAKIYTDQTHQTAQRYTDSAVAQLVDASPAALDTLRKLASALGNDASFAATMQNQLNSKVDKAEGKGLSTNDFTDIDKKKIELSSCFDYIVDSDAALARLHQNRDISSVLIRKGTWTHRSSIGGRGIELLPNVLHIVAEAGAELVFTVVQQGSCLYYSSEDGQRPVNTSLYRAEGLVIKNNSAAGTSCFGGMYNLYNCYGYFSTLYNVPVFSDCEHLDSCAANNTGTSPTGIGFYNCRTLYNCKAATGLKIGFDKCTNLIACTSEPPYSNGRQSFRYCHGVRDCTASGVIDLCDKVTGCVASQYLNSYASSASNSVYACANTFEGGWNQTL